MPQKAFKFFPPRERVKNAEIFIIFKQIKRYFQETTQNQREHETLLQCLQYNCVFSREQQLS